MGKLESAIKMEILRLAKREIRLTFLPLRREMRMMKIKLSRLSKDFTGMNQFAKEMRQNESEKLKLEATPEEVKASRITPERIRRLRKRLGLSQRELARLSGVTLGAVALWEKGKFRPAMNKKAVLVALRKLNKREVKKILNEKSERVRKETPTRKKAKIAK